MENKHLHEILSEQQYSFKPYFAERVIAKIEEGAQGIVSPFKSVLDFLFPKISGIALVASIVLLVISINSTGSFDFDSLTGLNTLEENVFYQDDIELF